MACYYPAVQVHSCYLNNSRGKEDRNFYNTFQLMDLWLAKETTFEKTEDLYLTRPDLLRNVFLIDRLKAAVMKLVLYMHTFFFF